MISVQTTTAVRGDRKAGVEDSDEGDVGQDDSYVLCMCRTGDKNALARATPQPHCSLPDLLASPSPPPNSPFRRTLSCANTMATLKLPTSRSTDHENKTGRNVGSGPIVRRRQSALFLKTADHRHMQRVSISKSIKANPISYY